MGARLICSGTLGAFFTTVLCSVASGHTMEELKKEFGEVPAPLAEITVMYERALATSDTEPAGSDQDVKDVVKAAAGANRARLHAAQHEMLQKYTSARLQTKCMELLEWIPGAERKVEKLEKAGKMQEAEQLQSRIDKAKAMVTISCPGPAK